MNRIVSSRFATYITDNLIYWLQKTATLRDEEAGDLAPNRQNIFIAIQAGLFLPAAVETAVQLILQVFNLVELTGYWREWILVIRQAIGRPQAATYRAKLLDQLGILYRLTGDLPLAMATHEDAAELAQQMGDTAELARIYFSLGTDCREARDYPAAARYAWLASENFAASGTTAPRNQAAIANLLGLVACSQGHYEKALGHYDTAVPLWQEAGLIAYRARSLYNKGLTLEKLKRYEEALPIYDEASRILDEAGLELDKVPVAINRGNSYYHLGQWSRAIAAYQSADTVALHRSDNLNYQALIATNLGHVFLETGELDQAGDFLEKGIGFYRQVGDEVNLANALCTLADVLARLGRKAEAHARYEESLRLAAQYPDDAFAREIKENCARGLKDL